MVAGTLGLAAVMASAASVDASVVSATATPEAAARPLVTAIDDWPPDDSAGQAVFGQQVRATGATVVRLSVRWNSVAPPGRTMPTAFAARDPDDPAYSWGVVDRRVQAVVSSGLVPMLSVLGAPEWAQSGQKERPNDGPVRPSPSALADFATALATRYGGDHQGLPRVTYWQVWNEPNLSGYLMPQSQSGSPVSPVWYRDMVNAMAGAVRAVHSDNVVVAGGLAPFGGDINDPSGGPVPNQERIHPLEFMRTMLCMSNGPQPRPACGERSEFDVWAHHPYTYGGPTHTAFHPDDVSLGDLAEMRALLEAAEAAGQIGSSKKVEFWVTEFSYDSQPADPKGLPPALHARWTSEALYRMWQNRVSLVTWFLLRDRPFPADMYQSGLYYRGSNGESDQPKPALRAFRFPFVAFRQKKAAITYWGRTPTSASEEVVVEQRQASRWRRLVTPAVDQHGIFRGRVTNAKRPGSLRARLVDGSDVSQPFSLTVPEDFRFCPWGSFC